MHPLCKILNTPVMSICLVKQNDGTWVEKHQRFFIQRLQAFFFIFVTFFLRFLTFFIFFLERFLHLWKALATGNWLKSSMTSDVKMASYSVEVTVATPHKTWMPSAMLTESGSLHGFMHTLTRGARIGSPTTPCNCPETLTQHGTETGVYG